MSYLFHYMQADNFPRPLGYIALPLDKISRRKAYRARQGHIALPLDKISRRKAYRARQGISLRYPVADNLAFS